jgi:spore germination cell wall hydrolase CwlJ-like protein
MIHLPASKIFQQVALAIQLMHQPSPGLLCTAEAVYFEARGEPLQGQIAVAQVIHHRMFAPGFPHDACRVVHQPRAFSYYWDHKPEVFKDKRAYREALVTAVFVTAGLYDDVTGGALYYHEKNKRPSWSPGHGLPIGGHLFYAGTK